MCFYGTKDGWTIILHILQIRAKFLPLICGYVESYLTLDSRAHDTTEARRSTFSIFLVCLPVSICLSSLCVLWVREHMNMAVRQGDEGHAMFMVVEG